jgi:superfamily I DNA and/or RNA helicase
MLSDTKPTGTGKTVTLVETILQLRGSTPPDFRLLVMAPSNTSADHFIELLGRCGVLPLEMLRLMAFNRDPRDVSDEILRFCVLPGASDRRDRGHRIQETKDHQHFASPPLATVLTYRIVVATCCMSTKLHHMGVERGHFGAVLVDESGNAMEPEVVAAIAGICADSPANTAASGGGGGVGCTQVVLAGDPMQLGPVVRSAAAGLGLGESLLERLMLRGLYQRDEERFPGDCRGYDRRVLSKLVRNYRSHPAVIAQPNALFYHGDLLACADPVRSHSLAEWPHLPTRGFPLVFHSVEGLNERQGSSPSWFNTAECTQVLRYVDLLLRDTRPPVAPSQIGIITPYAMQAVKLRMLLMSQGVPARGNGVMVGSTEQFQGQERRVIIISTVRSDPAHLESDLRHNLGFLSNPKRCAT